MGLVRTAAFAHFAVRVESLGASFDAQTEGSGVGRRSKTVGRARSASHAASRPACGSDCLRLLGPTKVRS